MPVKDEIRYEINPSEIEAGKKWTQMLLWCVKRVHFL
jgi:hypothetical protein